MAPLDHPHPLRILYAGQDADVWTLIERLPFGRAEQVACDAEGRCPVRTSGGETGHTHADVVIVDGHPEGMTPLQVLKSVRKQVAGMPVVVLAPAEAADTATAALDLGADDAILKTDVLERRLEATLRRLHQRVETARNQAETRAREERLRRIVDGVPAGVSVVAADGDTFAMNADAARLYDTIGPTLALGDTTDGRTRPLAVDATAVVEALVRQTARGGPAEPAREPEPADRPPPVVISGTATAVAAAVAAERQAWTSTNQTLEARLRETEAALQKRAAIADRLPALEHELGKARETLAREQQTWTEARKALEQATEEARRRLASERTEWARTRADLEAGSRDAVEQLAAGRSEWEQAQHALDHERQRLEAELGDERAGWQRTREELEHRTRQVEALLEAEHRRADDLQVQLDAMARAADERSDAARTAWEDDRSRLEQELHDREAAILEARMSGDRARQALDAVQAALRQSEAARIADRADWDGDRQALERALADADAERSAWRETEARLEEALERAHRNAAAGGALQSELDAARADLLRAEAARIADRADWESDRHVLERALADAEAGLDRSETARMADREAWADERATLEGRLAAAEATAQAVPAVEPERDPARRPRTAAPETADLNATIRRTESLLRRLAGHHMDLHIDLGAEPLAVRATGRDVHQVLTSLVTCGRDLLPAGGSVLVGTRANGQAGDPAAGVVLTVAARGFGVRQPDDTSILAEVIQRGGGRLRITKPAAWQVHLEVSFPPAMSDVRQPDDRRTPIVIVPGAPSSARQPAVAAAVAVGP